MLELTKSDTMVECLCYNIYQMLLMFNLFGNAGDNLMILYLMVKQQMVLLYKPQKYASTTDPIARKLKVAPR